MKSEVFNSPTRKPLDWSRLKKVLLIRLRSIGDTVLMTPCLQALKDYQSSLEISVVSELNAAPVLEGHPLLDHLYVADKTLSSRLRLTGLLRQEDFDVAFNLHGGSTATWLALMSGAKRTFGFKDQHWSWLLSDRAAAPDRLLGREKIHSVEQQLALLGFAGVPAPEQPRLSLAISPDATASVKTKLIDAGLTIASVSSGRFAIVAPGAAFESKRWGAREFASVIDHLDSRWQLQSIVIAGPGQKQIVGEVLRHSHAGAVVLSDISLAELKAAIGAFGSIFVGNDSGPMHLAGAFGCPVVAVFGSSNPDVWHPWTSANYRILGGERGTPDSNLRGSIDSVSVQDVTIAVDEVIESAATRAAS